MDSARQRWWLFSLLTNTVLAACLSLAVLLAFMAADALWRLPRAGLAAAAIAWLAATATAAVLVGRRLLLHPRGLEATARRVELEFPELGSRLINLVQLADERRRADGVFCRAAVDQAAAEVGQFAFHRAAGRESRRRRLLQCMQTPRDLAEALLVLLALAAAWLVCQRCLPAWGSAANRLLAPWHFVPAVGKVEIIAVSPGDTQVMAGDSVEVSARLNNPGRQAYSARLLVTTAGQGEAELPLTGDDARAQYRATIPAVLAPLQYRLEIGDSQTRLYSVQVRQKPAVEEINVTYRYPAYLGGGTQSAALKQADLEAPQFTAAELLLGLSPPVTAGHVQMGGDRFSGTIEDGGRRLRVTMPLLQSGAFTIHLFNDAGHTNPSPRLNQVNVALDRPPTVDLLKPGPECTATPGDKLAVTVRAGDDHGLGLVRLEMKVQNPGAESDAGARDEALQTWGTFGPHRTDAVVHYRLELDRRRFKAGQVVLLRGVARDCREVRQWGLDLGPQETAGSWHTVRIVASAARAAADAGQWDGLRSAMWRILEEQLRARSAAGEMLRRGSLAERIAAAGKVRDQQVGIQKATAALVQDRKEAQATHWPDLKRALAKLASGDMLAAVERCDDLLRAKDAAALPRPAGDLTAAQERIIKVLEKLLDVARHAERDALAGMADHPGSQLPDDVKQKLQQIEKKLAEFLQQQKRLIEATEDLAKKPVEDYTDEDRQLLQRLARSEDDWARFINDLHSDLSKLPEQDFANPSLAEELVEIQTELKMAADALLQKSAELAVPLEQLGYERAEELKTNLEKWLPDTPDREKWSQEESLTDQDKEAPMAELPGQLEDIVGNLMEEEENLFDEMEDVSSSAADSLDKGAGWDAVDGPISNNSAKGVTGNRLPNTSEIAGRSGEGRQGKSSGEFVGRDAVGKGGRNTPSRLTPDAYVKGQIQDRSKDPVGGATGGGKESGQGGAGLQGPPARPQGPRDLQRLAGKQAKLRNRAERLDLQFQANNFHHTDLPKLLDAMAQVERDLRAGRYQNALRQRRVLAEELGNIKQYLQGEFEVRRDATTNLPTDIQKQIIGSSQDPSPPGWEELNRRYFQRLSEGQSREREP